MNNPFSSSYSVVILRPSVYTKSASGILFLNKQITLVDLLCTLASDA